MSSRQTRGSCRRTSAVDVFLSGVIQAVHRQRAVLEVILSIGRPFADKLRRAGNAGLGLNVLVGQPLIGIITVVSRSRKLVASVGVASQVMPRIAGSRRPRWRLLRRFPVLRDLDCDLDAEAIVEQPPAPRDREPAVRARAANEAGSSEVTPGMTSSTAFSGLPSASLLIRVRWPGR